MRNHRCGFFYNSWWLSSIIYYTPRFNATKMFNTHRAESTLLEFRGEGPQTGIPCSARLSGDCLNFMEANPEAIEV